MEAIGREPNDQMLPIAFGVIRWGAKDSWLWFLELLIGDIRGRNECLLYFRL